MEQEEYLSINEAAVYIRKSTVTIRRWIKQKKIHAEQNKVDRTWRIAKSELEKAVNEYKSNQ